MTKKKEVGEIEKGDYQTPYPFVCSIYDKLKSIYSLSPTVVIEPTFGIGNFIRGAINSFNNIVSFYGIELNSMYYKKTKERFYENKEIILYNDDIFSFDFNTIKNQLAPSDELLIIGNPHGLQIQSCLCLEVLICLKKKTPKNILV